MQLYAFNEQNRIVSASQANRHHDYACLECRGKVRLRGGIHKQKHFFHLTLTENCSQRRKGMVHLQIQRIIEQLLPPGECFLERRFPEIGRIADVAWESQKIIFEVQCSGMHEHEALMRNRDYLKVGYQVVWILHDSRYNRWRISAVEEALTDSPHYYTNIDAEGRGCIYDQWRQNAKGLCQARLPSLAIDLRYPFRSLTGIESELQLIIRRKNNWRLHFQGDLLDAVKQKNDAYLLKAAEKEALLIENKQKTTFFGKTLQFFVRSYHIGLKFFIEVSCR